MGRVRATGGKGTVHPLVYLDYQATTPVDPRVVDAMLPWLSEHFGNPHSVDHRFGWIAHEAVEEARRQVASLIHADPRAVIFTSGATESNNLAIKGAMMAMEGARDHLITVASEHKCVLESARWTAARLGARLTILPVDTKGLIDLDQLAEAITERTALVSIMAVNNEIGVIQPLAEIGEICRQRGVWFHCDAAQGFGKIPLDIDEMKIDLMSISGHKIYGPKGIGALYVRRARPRVRLEPQMSGGGQEQGLRSGTLAPHQCVGLGRAAEIAAGEMDAEAKRTQRLFDRFWGRLSAEVEGIRLNGDRERRWPGNVNVTIPGVPVEHLIAALPDLAFSTGSACSSGSTGPSHVLLALGLDDEAAHASLRIGFGRFTGEAELDYAAERIVETVKRLRAERISASSPSG
ncbi:MAG: aminotransferase class V-fold PLP-dependent enzyme [Alphaproteobacteria bacterium]|nr:MAG: aminotransferase class V-fold PLP-dependent enzyme [Alphaproteobacteria bacterium]